MHTPWKDPVRGMHGARLRFAVVTATIFVVVLATFLGSTRPLPIAIQGRGATHPALPAADSTIQHESLAGVVSRGTAGGASTSPASAGGQVLANLTVGRVPEDLVYDGGHGYVYVQNNVGGVSVISGTRLLATLPVGYANDATSPGMAYDAGNGYVYTHSSDPEQVSVILGTTLVGNVTTGGGALVGGIAYDSGNGYVYVTDGAGCSACLVTVISGTTVVGHVTVGGFPGPILYDSGNGYVYVRNYFTSNISVILGTKVVATIPVGYNGNQPSPAPSMVYDRGNGYVYALNYYQASVSVISGTQLIATVPVGTYPSAVVYDNGNQNVYVVNQRCGSGPSPCLPSSNVSVISGTNVVASIQVGSGAAAAVYDSSNGYVYVANSGSNNVTVISDASVVDAIPVGSAPVDVVYDSGHRFVYVMNYGFPLGVNGTVSVIGVPSLSISSFVASPSTITLGGTTFFVASTTGGTGSLTYTYSALPPGCGNLNASALACTPTAAGDFTIGVLVSDSTGLTASAEASLIVQPKYSVAFTETGLPNGTVWSATLDGLTKFSATSSIVFTKPNGSYPYGISTVAGYTVSPQLGTVTLSGAAVSISVVFEPPPGPYADLGRFVSSPAGVPVWALSTIVVASVVIALLAVGRRHQKLRREGEEIIQVIRSLDDDTPIPKNEDGK